MQRMNDMRKCVDQDCLARIAAQSSCSRALRSTWSGMKIGTAHMIVNPTDAWSMQIVGDRGHRTSRKGMTCMN